MTNEEKARELSSREMYGGFTFAEQNAAYQASKEAMQWKDEEHKQEKQQLIERAWNFLDDLCDRNFLKKDDVFERFKETMKGE